MKHSAGPWYISETRFCALQNRLDISIVDANDKTVCTVSASGLSADEEKHLANARLIAAAPSLLYALRQAADLLKLKPSLNHDMSQEAMVEAAIASAFRKVKGED